MKVEVDVLGSPSLISLMISVDVKQHWNETPRSLVRRFGLAVRRWAGSKQKDLRGSIPHRLSSPFKSCGL